MPKQKNWRRRILLTLLFLCVFAVSIGLAGWWLARSEPQWYARHKLDPREVEAAANHVEQELQQIISWAQDRQAESLRQAHPSSPATDRSEALEITFTEDELNAFFQKWDSGLNWSGAYSRHLSDPQIALREGRVILFSKVTDLGAVLSIELAPRIEEGKLRMPIARLLAGRLPLPRTLWDRYTALLSTRVESKLWGWQRNADLSASRGANVDAMAAAMGELFLDVLSDRRASPVLFLPFSMSNPPRSLPVKLTEVRLEDQKLTMVIQPISPEQWPQVLNDIRNFHSENPERSTDPNSER